MQVSIFDYETFAAYFAAYIAEQKQVRRIFTFRYLCKVTGIKSPGQINAIASGKRFPTPDILEKLNEALNWKPNEYAFAQALIAYERAKTDAEKAVYWQKMREIAPTKNLSFLEKANTDIFLKWYIAAILEMTHLKDFKFDLAWISDRLGGKVSPNEVQNAIDILLKTGTAVKDQKYGLRRPQTVLRTKDNVPIYAVRGWHIEMMKQAQRAIHLQSPDERFFSGSTITISANRIKEMQALLAEFRERFVKLTEVDQGDETYHFAIQFFRLTQAASNGDENSREKITRTQASTKKLAG